MFDAHLHGPHAALEALPEHWSALFASSGPQEWLTLGTDSVPDQCRRMYGMLPQECPHHPTRTDLLRIVGDLDERLQSDSRAAIGEIGLDSRFVRTIGMDDQLFLCGALIDLAVCHSVPIAFHAVGCDGALIALLKRKAPAVPMLWHGFLGSIESAREAAALGCTVSIAPSVWRSGTKLQERLGRLSVPFLLETDFPWHYRLPGEGSPPYSEVLKRHYIRFAVAIGTDVETLEQRCDGHAKIFTDQ